MGRHFFFIITILITTAISAQDNIAVAQNNVVQSQSAGEAVEVRISGTVTDRLSHAKMENASVIIPNTNISTVTNADGFFVLKLKHRPNKIAISSLGYKTQTVNVTEDKMENLQIKMTPAAITLPEVAVWKSDPEDIMLMAIDRINDNFVQTRELQTSFYRETLQKGSRFIDISEAILSTCKRAYMRGVNYDQVEVVHGRHIVSQQTKDTLSVKMVGGPSATINFDVVKNAELLFDDIKEGCYAFNMELPEELDGKTQIVISFQPRMVKDWALYNGKVYLDQQTLAFTRMELDFDMEDEVKVTRMLLNKKPMGLRFKPLQYSTIVNYRDGRINYMKLTVRFKCDWKKHLISRTYTCCSEMVVTDFIRRYEGPNIEQKQRFNDRDALSNAVNAFSDAGFWNNYNIIEPTESLEKAINKLKKNQ